MVSAMWNASDASLPLAYSFNDDRLRRLFRKNQIGGLTNVFRRHICLENEDYPQNALYAPNGSRFTKIACFDFNRSVFYTFKYIKSFSMYLACMAKNMPLTPGLNWQLSNGKFKKRVLRHGVSLKQLQWIYWFNAVSDLCVENGKRVQIQHAYNKREFEEGGFRWDGYFEANGTKYYMEFCGCYYHHCPVCELKRNPEDEERFHRKKLYAEREGKFIVARECLWNEEYRETEFPRIMLKTENYSDLLPNILNDKLYGFVVCDVVAPKGFVLFLIFILYHV